MTAVDAVIIGAGSTGCSAAFHLSARGLRVAIIDKGHVAAGGTGNSAGQIRLHYACLPEARLAITSLPWFVEWAERVGRQSSGYVATGFIRIVRPEDEGSLRENVEALQREGADTSILTPQDVRELDEWTDLSDVSCVAYEPQSGYATPSDVAAGFLEAAVAAGAVYQPNSAGTRIRVRGSGVIGVRTSKGDYETETVIVAAGPWTPRLLNPLGVAIPVWPAWHEMVRFDRPSSVRHLSFQDGPNAVYARRDGDLNTIAGEDTRVDYVDPDNYPRSATFDGITSIGTKMVRRVPILADAQIKNGPVGIIDMSPDAHPIIGETFIRGLIVAAGMSGTGFKNAPAMGIGLAEIVTQEKTPTVDLWPFRPSRFAEGARLRSPLDYHDRL